MSEEQLEVAKIASRNQASPEVNLITAEQVVSPAILEEKMVEKALNEDPSGTPADKAAAFFQKSAAELQGLINGMSLRELKRMVMHVSTYPFLGKEYKVKPGTIEYKATYRFSEMMWHKTIMQLQFEQEKAVKEMEQDKNSNNESLKKGDTDNGTKET